jgi:putative ATPase
MEPFASKMRPKNLDEFVGQKHLVGPDKPLKNAIDKKYIFSFILWGPPGVGKTTLARIYAQSLNADYYELSAVSTGKEDIRKIIEKEDATVEQKPKVLFLDEIHRFNKVQQDFLLPYVETGKLTLIGATTENPSFEVIPALLSRCQVFVLNELSENDLMEIIDRSGFKLDTEAKEWLIRIANGDARQPLSLLEKTAKLYKEISVENLQNTLQNSYLRYDKKAEEHYNTISAFIKSMRASNVDAALYYLARMIQAGEDPKFIARRMVIFASEDIGLADLHALTIANNAFRAVEIIGYPECAINLSHGVCYLALAPKNRDSYNGYFAAVDDVTQQGNLPIPLIIRNAPTKLMKELNYGKGYQMYTEQDLLPDKLKGRKYFKDTKKSDNAT